MHMWKWQGSIATRKGKKQLFRQWTIMGKSSTGKLRETTDKWRDRLA